MTMQNKVVPNHKYKDTTFRFLFREKKHLLSLYNALNGSDYKNPEALEIYTIEDFIYMGMRNDLSFLIDSGLNIFEHQSTYNPNMPLRGFLYTAAAFRKYIADNRLDIYSSKLQTIPVPRHYVFYNGRQKMKGTDEIVLRLTGAMTGDNAAEISCTEFTTHMININVGHSSALLSRCPLLYEYSVFVAEVYANMDKDMELKEAIDEAVDDCIQRGGELADILRVHRAEITDRMIWEYDEALHLSNEKKISYDDGFLDGVNQEKEKTLKAELAANEEKQKAEYAQQLASEERQKAEYAQQLASEAEKRAENAEQKVSIFKLRLQGKSDEEIAEILNLPAEKIAELCRN